MRRTRRGRKCGRVRGSVTVYLALTFCVFCTVVLTAILSVKIAAGRAQAANSVDQSLYSLFARYDQRLERKYGLFFINAGGSGSAPAIGACIRELEDAADCLLCPNGGMEFFGGANLLHLERKQCAVTGYSLATDSGGAPFIREAEQVTKDTFGIQVISSVKDGMSASEDGMRRGEEIRNESEKASYSELREESRQVKAELEEEAREFGAEYEEPQAPEGFVNPIPFLQELQSRSVEDIVLPDTISRGSVDPAALVSGRTLATGMGPLPTGGDENSLYFKAFLLHNYSNFRAASAESALCYQLEYILCGRSSDLENMKEIVRRLMWLREGANIAAIYINTDLSDEVSAVSELLSALFLIPEAEPAFRLILAAGWAYAESIVDLRALIMGKRVAMVKSGTMWQTDLWSITEFLWDIDSLTLDDYTGFDYEDYLGVLLLKDGSGSAMRAMDMTEAQIRGMGSREFRLDHCIYSLSMEMKIRSEGRVDFTVEKELGYDDL